MGRSARSHPASFHTDTRYRAHRFATAFPVFPRSQAFERSAVHLASAHARALAAEHNRARAYRTRLTPRSRFHRDLQPLVELAIGATLYRGSELLAGRLSDARRPVDQRGQGDVYRYPFCRDAAYRLLVHAGARAVRRIARPDRAHGARKRSI